MSGGSAVSVIADAAIYERDQRGYGTRERVAHRDYRIALDVVFDTFARQSPAESDKAHCERVSRDDVSIAAYVLFAAE